MPDKKTTTFEEVLDKIVKTRDYLHNKIFAVRTELKNIKEAIETRILLENKELKCKVAALERDNLELRAWNYENS